MKHSLVKRISVLFLAVILLLGSAPVYAESDVTVTEETTQVDNQNQNSDAGIKLETLRENHNLFIEKVDKEIQNNNEEIDKLNKDHGNADNTTVYNEILCLQEANSNCEYLKKTENQIFTDLEKKLSGVVTTISVKDRKEAYDKVINVVTAAIDSLLSKKDDYEKYEDRISQLIILESNLVYERDFAGSLNDNENEISEAGFGLIYNSCPSKEELCDIEKDLSFDYKENSYYIYANNGYCRVYKFDELLNVSKIDIFESEEILKDFYGDAYGDKDDLNTTDGDSSKPEHNDDINYCDGQCDASDNCDANCSNPKDCDGQCEISNGNDSYCDNPNGCINHNDEECPNSSEDHIENFDNDMPYYYEYGMNPNGGEFYYYEEGITPDTEYYSDEEFYSGNEFNPELIENTVDDYWIDAVDSVYNYYEILLSQCEDKILIIEDEIKNLQSQKESLENEIKETQDESSVSKLQTKLTIIEKKIDYLKADEVKLEKEFEYISNNFDSVLNILFEEFDDSDNEEPIIIEETPDEMTTHQEEITEDTVLSEEPIEEILTQDESLQTEAAVEPLTEDNEPSEENNSNSDQANTEEKSDNTVSENNEDSDVPEKEETKNSDVVTLKSRYTGYVQKEKDIDSAISEFTSQLEKVKDTDANQNSESSPEISKIQKRISSLNQLKKMVVQEKGILCSNYVEIEKLESQIKELEDKNKELDSDSDEKKANDASISQYKDKLEKLQNSVKDDDKKIVDFGKVYLRSGTIDKWLDLSFNMDALINSCLN